MKKRFLCGLVAAAMLLSLLTACGPAADSGPTPTPPAGTPTQDIQTLAPTSPPTPVPTPPPVCNLSVTAADIPQAQFAGDEIMAAAKKRGVEDAWTVKLETVDESLGYEAYRVEVDGRTITVTGGDANGLMYGGLEVAEQIALYGAEGVKEAAASPYVLHRGYMFNAPLDMRTPSYNSAGTSGQNNIATMWDIDFWHGFFDDMARNRFNVFILENINPYPSMVQVEGYEDIALNDVWRSTIPPDNTIAGNCVNLVEEKHWENYEVLKEITSGEKIAFWREVMAYAKERGVEFHIKHSNIYTFVEDGKYGITDDPSNPVTQDYYYKSAKALLETYPDLKGLFLTPGENMNWGNDSDSKAHNVQWLHDVFGKAVNEVLAEDPDREFYFAVNVGASNRFVGIMEDMDANVLYAAQYSGTHMYATSTPHTADATFAMVEGAKFWMQFRNEDCFNMRWGDPDFMREFTGGMPGPDTIYGCITGSDGYCYGRDWSSTDPEFQGQPYTEKHWFNFFLIGRMTFEPDLDDRRIKDVFLAHYENETNADVLLEATSEAGKIIPQVNKIYYQTNSDYTWFVEGNWSHPNAVGYIDLKRWMKNDTTYVDGATMSIEEYAVLLATGQELPQDGRQRPPEVAETLRQYGEDVLAKVAQIRSETRQDGYMSFAQKEFWKLVTDDEAMAYLGLFYSERVLGAIDIRLFNETKDESYRASSIRHLEQSAEYFDKYAEIISANYVPQQLARVGYFDISEIAKSVRGDIEIAQKWKPRKLTSSVRPPDKDDYMRGE